MKVTIVGAGNMGRGIGTRVLAGGHAVEIVDRDPEQARALAEELDGAASALAPDDAFGGDVVVFAVYYPGIKDAVREYANRVAGKVVVDITNPVDTETWDDLATPPGTSSAEEVAQLVPEGTPVVKAFNTTFAPTLVAGEVSGQQLDVLIAGDDEDAKRKVAQLVSDGGLRPVDVGGLRRAAAGAAARAPGPAAHRCPAATRPTVSRARSSRIRERAPPHDRPRAGHVSKPTSVFLRILCGVDGTSASLAAVRAAARLQLAEGSLRFVAAANFAKAAQAGMDATHAAEQLQDEAEAALAEARALEPSAPGKLVIGNPAAALLREAESDETTLVVVGSHGHRRTAAMLLATVALTLLRDAPCSVLIAREPTEPETWPRAVVAGVDGSSESAAALTVARELADRFEASVRAVASTSDHSTVSWPGLSRRNSRSTPKGRSVRSWPRRSRLTSSSWGVAGCTA
jgi:predicted dinucleotide-binding enzyme/nucleotide-binding universal stress UspA family protein